MHWRYGLPLGWRHQRIRESSASRRVIEEVEANEQEEEEEETEEEVEDIEEPPVMEFDPTNELDVRRFNRQSVRSVHYTVDPRRRDERNDLSSLTYKKLYLNVGERESAFDAQRHVFLCVLVVACTCALDADWQA